MKRWGVLPQWIVAGVTFGVLMAAAGAAVPGDRLPAHGVPRRGGSGKLRYWRATVSPADEASWMAEAAPSGQHSRRH
jgi:hypothetical protein